MTAMPTEALGLPMRTDLTRDDLDAMPDDGYRYELIDGILIVSPAPRRVHHRPSETCTSLCGSLARRTSKYCWRRSTSRSPTTPRCSPICWSRPARPPPNRTCRRRRCWPSRCSHRRRAVSICCSRRIVSGAQAAHTIGLSIPASRRYWPGGSPTANTEETAHVIGDDTFTVEQPLPLSVGAGRTRQLKVFPRGCRNRTARGRFGPRRTGG